MDVADRYLDQMIRALCRFDGVDDFIPIAPDPRRSPLKAAAHRAITVLLAAGGLELVRRRPFDAETRRLGRDWPVHADTMIGVRRLENLRDLVRTVIREAVRGDLVETGVWRGGASILMTAALEAYGDQDRRVWCADSFAGLPPPDLDRYPQDIGMVWHAMAPLQVSLEEVKRNFARYDLLGERVRFLPGWFKDTLPGAPVEHIALLRLDGDLYASTMDALTALYDRVSPGGFVIADDYGIVEDTCRRAVDDFRAARGIVAPLQDIDGWGVFWRKDDGSAEPA